MPLDTLEDVLKFELNDLILAETQFTKALRLVVRSASVESVKLLADEHLGETLQHIETLKRVLISLGARPEKGVHHQGARGIVNEGESALRARQPRGSIKDLALLGNALRIEHYEVASHGIAVALAKALGKRDIVTLLQTNLKREQAAIQRLESAMQQLIKDVRNPMNLSSNSRAAAAVTRTTRNAPQL